MKMPDYLRVKVVPSTAQIIVEAVEEKLAPVVCGKWKETKAYPHHVYCSECFRTFVYNKEWLKSNGGFLSDAEYCPHCGAKMMEEVSE